MNSFIRGIPSVKQGLRIVMRGITVVGTWLWNILLTPSPFAPVMLFYMVAPILIVYIYLTSPGGKIGLDYIGQMTHLPWFAPPVIFIICALIGYENRLPQVNALLTMPMAFYAFVILVTSLAGTASAGGLLTALYMATAAWSTLSLTRYYQELTNLKLAVKALERIVDDNKRKAASSNGPQSPDT